MAKKKPKVDESPPDPDFTNRPVAGSIEIVRDILPPSANRKVAKREQIPLTPPNKPFIRRLLEDDISLAKIRELAEHGASITTIEAQMKYPPGKLQLILQKGRSQVDSKGPYKRFYLMFRSWVAIARGKAEEVMSVKTPEKWLDRNSSNRVLESELDRSLALETAKSAVKPGVPVEHMKRALEILRQQGISIDEMLDKGQLHITSNQDNQNDTKEQA